MYSNKKTETSPRVRTAFSSPSEISFGQIREKCSQKIAAVTTVRNEPLFLKKWIQYYASQFGAKNLFVIVDGHDQKLPEAASNINTLFLPYQPMQNIPAMRRRSKVMSGIARGLFNYFDAVLVLDIDEFIVVDPILNISLADHISSQKSKSTISALGLDVGQHLLCEGPLDANELFLEQRQFAHVSARYTKPSIAFQPVNWGSGMHRIKGKNFRIDPNLFLFHFGMVDQKIAAQKTADADRLSTGWGAHNERRKKLFDIITEAVPIEGDKYFAKARKYQTWHRPFYALNKPGVIPGNPVIRIPERFRGIV